MTDDYEYYNDICYECGGYGDDYYYDEELDELVCRCGTCWVNGRDEDDILRSIFPIGK